MHVQFTTPNILNARFKAYATVLHKDLRYYNAHQINLLDLLTALDSLATGHLPHNILDPEMVASYLNAVEEDVQIQDQQY